jgi:tight adherence protein B
MTFFVNILGSNGLMVAIAIMVFIFSIRYANEMFEWVENQTFGTRSYILEKLELLFIEIPEQRITYALLFLSIGTGGLCFIIFGFLGKWTMGTIFSLIFAYIGFRIPRPFMDFLVRRRIKQYSSQMVDGLTLLANGIRAGLSMPQAIGMVVSEMPIPISQEFNLMLQQNRIGVPLEECFDNLATRVPTEDNDMFVSSVNILRETGGNLAETFDTIVSVIRERIRLQQKIDTYVAQGMFQGVTIFCMPFAIGTIYAISDPGSMTPLFTTPFGIIMLILALGFDIAGGIIILKIVKIKI